MTDGPQEVTIEQMAADVAQLRGSAEHIDTGVVKIMQRQVLKLAAVILAVLISLVAVGSAVAAVKASHRAEHQARQLAAQQAQLNDFLQQRTVSRDRVCTTDNETTLRLRAAIVGAAVDGVKTIDTSQGTPDQKERLRVFILNYTAAEQKAAEDLLPLRDCSPEAIARFYGDPVTK